MLDLYCTDPAEHLVTAGDDLHYLDRDLSYVCSIVSCNGTFMDFLHSFSQRVACGAADLWEVERRFSPFLFRATW